MSRGENPGDDRMFRLAVEASPTGMILVDSKGRIILANSKVEMMFGYRSEELLGLDVEVLLPEALHTRHIELREIYMADPAPRSMGSGLDLEGRRKDGRCVRVEIGLSPLRLDDRLYVMASIVDISARLKTARRLARSAAELERSNEDLETFTRVASRDLRAPLEGLESLAQQILEDRESRLSEGARERLEEMKEELRRLETLLDDLLRLSRAGRHHDRSETVDLRALARELFEACDPPPAFLFKTENLPVFRTPLAPIGQVLRHLIENAIRHHDRPEGCLTLRGSSAGPFYRFALQDDGPGIPEEFQHAAFRMFQTLAPRSHARSSGLGLALVKRIVEFYGGEVSLESKEGQGATFAFTWPKVVDLAGEEL